jgi:hypothetical protein
MNKWINYGAMQYGSHASELVNECQRPGFLYFLSYGMSEGDLIEVLFFPEALIIYLNDRLK